MDDREAYETAPIWAADSWALKVFARPQGGPPNPGGSGFEIVSHHLPFPWVLPSPLPVRSSRLSLLLPQPFLPFHGQRATFLAHALARAEARWLLVQVSLCREAQNSLSPAPGRSAL